jgi:hypothetical protein
VAQPINPVPATPAVAQPINPVPATPAVTQLANPVPATPASYTLDDLARAGAELVEKGKMAQIMALIQKYGVQAINQLQPSAFPQFAADLKSLGANI